MKNKKEEKRKKERKKQKTSRIIIGKMNEKNMLEATIVIFDKDSSAWVSYCNLHIKAVFNCRLSVGSLIPFPFSVH